MTRVPRYRAPAAVLVSSIFMMTVAAFTASAAAPAPNPCTIVPATTVASTVGLKGVSLTGKLSSRPDGLVKQRLCTYTHGTTTLEILLAPHQTVGGSGGGLPGMITATPSELGSAAHDYYDTEAKYAFANVEFTKGNVDGGAYDKGTIPNNDIVALARLVYKALP